MTWLAPWFSVLAALCLLLAPGLTTVPSAPPTGAAIGHAAQSPTTQTEATLLAWSTVERLLGGEVLGGPTPGAVRAAVADFPAHWPVVGVGTTDWMDRNGELMPDGHASGLQFWWADPAGPRPGAISDLASPKAGSVLGEPRFPFLGLAVGDPTRALHWTVSDVDDLHTWLNDRLAADRRYLGRGPGPRRLWTRPDLRRPLAAVDWAGLERWVRRRRLLPFWRLPRGRLDAQRRLCQRPGRSADRLSSRRAAPPARLPGRFACRRARHRAAVRHAIVTVWPLDRIERRAERNPAGLERFLGPHGPRRLSHCAAC